jgi:hypothetical protein
MALETIIFSIFFREKGPLFLFLGGAGRGGQFTAHVTKMFPIYFREKMSAFSLSGRSRIGWPVYGS